MTDSAALEYLAGERVYRLVGDLDTRQPDGQWRMVPRSRPVLLERRGHMRTPVSATIVHEHPSSSAGGTKRDV